MISTIDSKLRTEGCKAEPYMGSLLAQSRFPSGNNIYEDLQKIVKYHLYHLYHPHHLHHRIRIYHCFTVSPFGGGPYHFTKALLRSMAAGFHGLSSPQGAYRLRIGTTTKKVQLESLRKFGSMGDYNLESLN